METVNGPAVSLGGLYENAGNNKRTDREQPYRMIATNILQISEACGTV
jgi:hypothetical protein